MLPQPEGHTPTGVIHDIGYRGYEGRRLGRGQTTRALFVHSLRGVYGLGRSAKSKVLPFSLVALMILPAFILAVVTVIGSGQQAIDGPILDYSGYATMLQGVIAIFVAIQAPQTVSLDLRFHTLPLYLSRPLERFDYVVAKYAALSLGVFMLLAVPILIMYAGALLAELSFGGETIDVLIALAGAALFSLVLSGIGLMIASLTSRRGFGVAGIITVLALSYSIVSVLQQLVGSGSDGAAAWIGLFSPITLVDGVQVWAFGTDSFAAAAPESTAAGIVFCLVTLVVIAGCFRLLLARYRRVKL